MIPPIDPSAAHHWNTGRHPSRSGDRPAPGKRPAPRDTAAPHDELTLWQVLIQPEVTEKSGFAAAFEAAERQASYRIAFYQAHQPDQTEPAAGPGWDTRA